MLSPGIKSSSSIFSKHCSFALGISLLFADLGIRNEIEHVQLARSRLHLSSVGEPSLLLLLGRNQASSAVAPASVPAQLGKTTPMSLLLHPLTWVVTRYRILLGKIRIALDARVFLFLAAVNRLEQRPGIFASKRLNAKDLPLSCLAPGLRLRHQAGSCNQEQQPVPQASLAAGQARKPGLRQPKLRPPVAGTAERTVRQRSRRHRWILGSSREGHKLRSCSTVPSRARRDRIPAAPGQNLAGSKDKFAQPAVKF